jgi:hypothetical protein
VTIAVVGAAEAATIAVVDVTVLAMADVTADVTVDAATARRARAVTNAVGAAAEVARRSRHHPRSRSGRSRSA